MGAEQSEYHRCFTALLVASLNSQELKSSWFNIKGIQKLRYETLTSMDKVNCGPVRASVACCKEEPGEDSPNGAGMLACHMGFPVAADTCVPPPVRDALYLKLL